MRGPGFKSAWGKIFFFMSEKLLIFPTVQNNQASFEFIHYSSLLHIKNSQVNLFGFVHHPNECFTTSSGRHFSTVATSCITNHLLIILVVIFFRWCWHTKNDLNRNQKDNNYTQQIFHLAFWVDYDQLKSCQLSAHHGKKSEESSFSCWRFGERLNNFFNFALYFKNLLYRSHTIGNYLSKRFLETRSRSKQLQAHYVKSPIFVGKVNFEIFDICKIQPTLICRK